MISAIWMYVKLIYFCENKEDFFLRRDQLSEKFQREGLSRPFPQREKLNRLVLRNF